MTKLFIYIMVDPDKTNRCNVGITKDPEQRLKAYRTANPQCNFCYLEKIPNKRFEKEVFETLKTIFRADREYVHTSPSIIKNIIDGLLSEKE